MHRPAGRRRVLRALSLGSLALSAMALARPPGRDGTLDIGAAWRGPREGDPFMAGVLRADWPGQGLQIRHAVKLPTRPHGLWPEPGGGLLVVGVRPGGWLLRIDADGRIERQIDLTRESRACRLSGHLTASATHLFTTEIDFASGQGRIGVRDRDSLRKVDEWASGGVEPHQALFDGDGHLMVANGGLPRSIDDRRLDLDRMDASLVRLDGRSGRVLRRWTLDDPRLSLRHLAWSRPAAGGEPFLGVALQAEHDDPSRRAAAPCLAVLDGDELLTPTRDAADQGHAGDISAAAQGGFALSNLRTGRVHLWHPSRPAQLTPIVEMAQAQALVDIGDPSPGRGVLVATALGLVRWHARGEAAFLRWPQPMALDNHWVVMG
jgi:hypothetical protein